jgi:hypothetical protein
MFVKDRLDSVGSSDFNNTFPYPWINPHGIINDNTFTQLVSSYPALSLFEHHQDMPREYGQKSHNRYELVYDSSLKAIPEIWENFIDELKGPTYNNFLSRLLGFKDYSLKFQWQCSSGGGDLSPHTDSPKKIATHIFYMLNEDNWNEGWGGGTLILDDRHQLDYRSSPSLKEFKVAYEAKTHNGYSLLFKRSDHSWHALKPLLCPTETLRPIFSVIVYPKLFGHRRITDTLLRRPRVYFTPTFDS